MVEPRKDRTAVLLRLLPVLLLLAAVALVWWWRREPRPTPSPADTAPPAAATADAADQTAAGERKLTAAEQQWLDATGRLPQWPADFGNPADCKRTLDDLRSLCTRLDARPRVREWGLDGGTFNGFREAVRALENKRPPLDGLFLDVDRFRANVTHLLRALGAERLDRLLYVAREEPWIAEPFALATYQWLSTAGRCDVTPRPPDPNVQYDYAAFLVQSVGGQAYLRRRSPRLEALAGFYALQIVERAVERKHDPQGVDLLREIARCKELIEGSTLVFRDRYLAVLAEMEARWTPAR